MADSFVQVNQNVTPGKKLKTYEVPEGGNVVDIEAVALNDTAGNYIAVATEATLEAARESLAALASFAPIEHDFAELGYDGSNNLISVVYRIGGAGGVQVSRLDLTYTGAGLLQTITRS